TPDDRAIVIRTKQPLQPGALRRFCQAEPLLPRHALLSLDHQANTHPGLPARLSGWLRLALHRQPHRWKAVPAGHRGTDPASWRSPRTRPTRYIVAPVRADVAVEVVGVETRPM